MIAESWTELGLAAMSKREEVGGDRFCRTELSLRKVPTFLQRKRRPGEYEVLRPGKIPEVTLKGLLVWAGILLLP